MTNVLGVHDGHDAGAALIHGREIHAVNEERLSRKKYHRGFPKKSVKEVIRLSNLKTSDIDVIAVAGIYRKKKRLLTLKNDLDDLVGDVDIITVQHHDAHAAGAYFTSGLKNSIVLTIDAAGDGLSSAVYIGERGNLKKVAESSYLDSLGDFYASITEMLGFVPMRHEGKVMALSAYHESKDHHDFKDCIDIDGLGFDNPLEVTGSGSVKEISKRVDFPLNRKKDCSKVLRDDKREHELWEKAVKIAASAQEHIEDLLEKLCENIIEDKRIEERFKKNICYSGGVAQNVKANKIIKEKFENSYVFPHMGDGGLALGAALLINQNLTDEKVFWDWKPSSKNVYLGPGSTRDRVKNTLDEYEEIKWDVLEEKAEFVSSLLTDGKIIGLFQGKMEYGPRALGNRSIIADPSEEKIKERLNSMLGREKFQPFSPTILKGYQDDYLKDPEPNKFMTMSFDITEKAEQDLPAAIHIDKTCRPQILERKDNPYYYDIIKSFESKTGVGAVLNTSFNLHGEPIVCTPQEAISSFKRISLDALVIEDFFLIKN